MRNKFWEKRIPTLLGLLLITIAIGITTLLVGQNTFFVQQASPTSNPQDIRITNISDSSFTVSYETASKILGSINFGKDQKLGLTISDEKDKANPTEHTIHSFKVENLDPATKYYFSIVSGQDSYLNNGIPYEVITGSKILEKSGSGFIVGKVVTVENTPPKEAIVYMTANGAQALSAPVTSDGSYTLSLETLRNQELSSYFKFSPGDKIKMLVVSGEGQSSVEISAKDVNYVPTIVISKNYDFTQSSSEIASSSAKLQFPTISSGKSTGPQINTPRQNQTFSDQKPLFKGTGVPSDKVNILIESNEQIQGQVVVDANGNWSFKPATALSSGQHKITITARDSSGILRTITQTFTIFAPQTAQAATASASPSLSPSPTPTPTPTPAASLFPTPTPTATPIVISTPTPVATVRPTLAPTGTSEVSMGLMGALLAVVGGIFFFLSRVLL
ncbi:MAG TPA: Ig-like domain-containing protein [Patescibacteria group bacterium]|nr:Ig-like domain-containing protein [Patescibacteria group bacterium]